MTNTPASFEGALSESEELLLLLDANKANPSNALIAQLQGLLASVPGCRAFFVVLLTGGFAISDEAPEFLLESIRNSSIAQELLVKNLVMSSATRISHLRRSDAANAQGSALVTQRSLKLIQSLKSPEVKVNLLAMKASLKLKDGKFAEFAARCNYDSEQCDAACGAIDTAMQAHE